MSQYVKPIADKNNGGAWSGNISGSTTYLDADEGVAGANDFTDYAVQPGIAGNSDGAPLVWKVTSISTPGSGNATFRIRHYANQTAQMTCEIRQGYVNESNKGTLLGSMVKNHPGGGVFQTDTGTVAISGATDGTDLYFRFLPHATSGSTTQVAITATDADMPDAGITGSGSPVLSAPTGAGTLIAAWTLSGSPVLPAPTGTGQGHFAIAMSGSAVLQLACYGTMTADAPPSSASDPVNSVGDVTFRPTRRSRSLRVKPH